MKNRTRLLLSGLMLSLSVSSHAMTNDEGKKIVEPFYAFLSGKISSDEVKETFSPDWKNYASDTYSNTLDETVGYVSNVMRTSVPDLEWTIMQVHVTSDNKVIVRGKAKGTPKSPTFLGIPMSGKSFEIMSIDIHTVEGGKITESYHLEDWAGAMRQLNQN